MSRVWRGSKPDSPEAEALARWMLDTFRQLMGRWPTQEELDESARSAGILDENGNGVRMVIEDWLPRFEA